MNDIDDLIEHAHDDTIFKELRDLYGIDKITCDKHRVLIKKMCAHFFVGGAYSGYCSSKDVEAGMRERENHELH